MRKIASSSIILLTTLTITKAQRNNRNRLRNYEQHRTLEKNDIFGETSCTEPSHRFSDEVPNGLLQHNNQLVSTPKQWVCEFCDVNLYQVVQKVCCGVSSRKRRDANTMDFWFHDEIKEEKGNKTHPNAVGSKNII